MSSCFSENCEKLGWTAMRADSVSSADLTSGSVGAAATDPMHHPEEADETPLAGLRRGGCMSLAAAGRFGGGQATSVDADKQDTRPWGLAASGE